jgi:hypothetical protein
MLLNYLRGKTKLSEISSSLVEAITFYDMPPYGSLASIPGN